MNELILYTNPQSRGRIAHWMMEELGEPYQTVWLDYATTMRGHDYLAVNPMGKVPAVLHDGVVITETAAICTYLADCFPEKQLIPAVGDPRRADFYRWMFFAAGPVEQAVTTRSMNWEVPDDSEKQGMLGFGNFDKTFATLKLALQPGPYICGEQFTAVDVYLGSQLSWGMMFGTIEKLPEFEEYVARVVQRPAALRADEINMDYVKTQEGAE